MKFTAMAVAVNQLDIKDVEAIQHTTEMLRKVIDHYGEDVTFVSPHYGEDVTFVSPNTGEVIQTAEIPRVLGILDFFLVNRVVEINT